MTSNHDPEKLPDGAVPPLPKKKNRLSGILPPLLIAAGLVCIAVYLVQTRPPMPVPSPTPTPVSPPSAAQPASNSEPVVPSPADPTAAYPAGELFVTAERDAYTDGEMSLSIARLGLEDLPVMGAVDEKTLAKGVGLYDYAQLPGSGNRNVSIAGHRDIYGREFYYIDTLTTGDTLVLHWHGQVFTYRYRDTRIVEADDWSPIYIQGFSCLTLTSCDPIGTSKQRIIVRAELLTITAADSPR